MKSPGIGYGEGKEKSKWLLVCSPAPALVPALIVETRESEGEQGGMGVEHVLWGIIVRWQLLAKVVTLSRHLSRSLGRGHVWRLWLESHCG